MSDINKSEPITLKDSSKDAILGISLSGIMLMLSGGKNTVETQIKAVEYFKENEKQAIPVQEWCDYQLTLLNTGDYMIPLPSVQSFVNALVEKIQQGKNSNEVFLNLVAASQHEAGIAMSAKSPIYKSMIDDYCENILFSEIDDHSKLSQWDKFSLITGYSLYHSLAELNMSNEFDSHIDEVVEADKRTIEKINNKVSQ